MLESLKKDVVAMAKRAQKEGLCKHLSGNLSASRQSARPALCQASPAARTHPAPGWSAAAAWRWRADCGTHTPVRRYIGNRRWVSPSAAGQGSARRPYGSVRKRCPPRPAQPHKTIGSNHLETIGILKIGIKIERHNVLFIL